MSLIIAALIGLLALAASRHPEGRLWRVLVEAPARTLNRLTWQKALITAIVLTMAITAAELVVLDLAWILAADIVAWIELFAASLIVTRVLPGWRAFRAWAGRIVPTAIRARPRTSRARRIRRPSPASDDSDPGWGLAFA